MDKNKKDVVPMGKAITIIIVVIVGCVSLAGAGVFFFLNLATNGSTASNQAVAQGQQPQGASIQQVPIEQSESTAIDSEEEISLDIEYFMNYGDITLAPFTSWDGNFSNIEGAWFSYEFPVIPYTEPTNAPFVLDHVVSVTSVGYDGPDNYFGILANLVSLSIVRQSPLYQPRTIVEIVRSDYESSFDWQRGTFEFLSQDNVSAEGIHRGNYGRSNYVYVRDFSTTSGDYRWQVTIWFPSEYESVFLEIARKIANSLTYTDNVNHGYSHSLYDIDWVNIGIISIPSTGWSYDDWSGIEIFGSVTGGTINMQVMWLSDEDIAESIASNLSFENEVEFNDGNVGHLVRASSYTLWINGNWGLFSWHNDSQALALSQDNEYILGEIARTLSPLEDAVFAANDIGMGSTIRQQPPRFGDPEYGVWSQFMNMIITADQNIQNGATPASQRGMYQMVLDNAQREQDRSGFDLSDVIAIATERLSAIN